MPVGIFLTEDIAYFESYYISNRDNAMNLIPGVFLEHVIEELKLESYVLNWIYVKLSYLLNINNCVYNELYL